MSTAILIVAIVIAVGSYLIWLAGRLDRLAVRVESARASLDAQLLRRAVAAYGVLAVTEPGPIWRAELDRVTSAVLDGGADHEGQQSELTRAIRGALPELPAGEHRAALIDTSNRVRFARQFHNDTVHATLALRRRVIVRWLRLWGTARAPRYFEIDDSLD